VELSRPELLKKLRRGIEEVETSQRPRSRSRVETGVKDLDALFPGGGLRRGMILELIPSADGAGACTLGILLARRACGEKQVLVVVDEHGCFYPLAASRLGIDLRRCLVVRPRGWRDAYSAISQSLRCAAVGCVIGWCARIGMTDYQRFRLAAERGGGLGLLIRPPEALKSPAGARGRFLVSPIASGRRPRKLIVEVLRGQGRGQSLTLEIDDEAGDVHPSTCVANSAAPARKAKPAV
jgi:hypothetical protein